MSILNQNDIEKYIYHLPVKKINGIGKKTQILLEENKVNTIQEFLFTKEELSKLIVGEDQWNKLSFNLSSRCYMGSILKNNFPKSISKSITSPIHLNIYEWSKLVNELAIYVYQNVRDHRLLGRTIRISLKTQNFKLVSHQKTFTNFIKTEAEFLAITKNLFNKLSNPSETYRLASVTFDNLIYKWRDSQFIEEHQYKFDSNDKQIIINNIITKLNKKYHDIFFNGKEYEILKNK